MLDVSARLLELLSLLQSRHEWPGPELAERLAVSARTLRRDVDRLRSLGYPVKGTTGAAGGYRLGPGASLPPLLLDDDEAVAVALGLRLAVSGTVTGIEDASLGVFLKLQQLLPSRLRHRVGTLHAAIAAAPEPHRHEVSADALVALADACRRSECVRFDYQDHRGVATTRLAEPHQVVFAGARWYLVAWDRDRDGWRSFRLDRLRLRQSAGPRFVPRIPPEGDFAAYLSHQLGFAMWPIRAVLRVHAPAAAVTGKILGVVEPLDVRTCKLTVAGDSLDAIASFLGLLGADFEVIEPTELREHLAKLAARFQLAAREPAKRQTAVMHEVLVALPSGAGVVRDDDGLLVTTDVNEDGGEYVREEDPFHPVVIWVDESRSAVGGLLPPGAVSAEAVDDRDGRVAAAVGHGAYIAVLDQPNEGEEPVVCCRDTSGTPVRRPWAADYPSVRVADAEVQCPACGALDWEEYTPFEEWRGGTVGPNGAAVANPVVSCRVCGHEEPEPTFSGMYAQANVPADEEDEATRAARVSRLRARFRKRWWLAGRSTLRAVRFPIYAADGWPTRLGGSKSDSDQPIAITVHHYDRADAYDLFAGNRPRFTITTKRERLDPDWMLSEARWELQNWLPQDADVRPRPDASHAAITLQQQARRRARRAAVLSAIRSEQTITIDETAVSALVLSGPSCWVASAHHADLTILVAARDITASELRLKPVVDPTRELLGPEPPDA